MQRPSANPQVNVETLKLLLQTAWADDTLDPKEREAVAALCERWAVPEEVSRTLLERLDLGKPLPPPNLELLRAHRDVVLAAAEWFIGVDGVIDEQEKDFIATVSELLAS
jgi:hypothetical protein